MLPVPRFWMCKNFRTIPGQPTNTKLGEIDQRRWQSFTQNGIKNVVIYAFSLSKILNVRQIAGVKDNPNIMSGLVVQIWIKIIQKKKKLDKSSSCMIKMWFHYETCAAAIITARILSNASLLLSHYFFSREHLLSQ